MIEFAAVIFSLLSVIYTTERNIFSWIYGILGIIFYSIVFYQQSLYSNLTIQPIFFIQSIYGILNWRNNVQEGNLKIESVNDIRIPAFAAMAISFIFLVIFNKSVSPIMDSVTSAFSIVAYYLLGKRKFENWVFWMIANGIYIIMFLSQQMYLSSLLYCVFFSISVLGYIKWKKRYEQKI